MKNALTDRKNASDGLGNNWAWERIGELEDRLIEGLRTDMQRNKQS